MPATVIELDAVGKRYRLGEHHGARPDLREALARTFRRLGRHPAQHAREFWSLRDVSFTVPEATALGIVGANGAGKSTLLKVINGITTPTTGRSRTRGRIGSLLEVGTGFHGELTGLENTYLNGAILGMSRREVTARLDEIVSFARLERFMDTPVKRYSSGMFLRLGFAIAAHMEAEILLVDEVLAVGDAEFQRKCLGKMDEVEKSGRTVLFVSHNMDAMMRLCPTSVWLEAGRVRAIGPTEQIVVDYMRSSAPTVPDVALDVDAAAAAQVSAVRFVDDDGLAQSTIGTRTPAWIEVDVEVREPVPGLDISCLVLTQGGVCILDEALSDVQPGALADVGRFRISCCVPPILTPGEYAVSIWLGSAYDDLQQLDNIVAFAVEGSDFGRPRRLITMPMTWRASRVDDHVREPG